MTHTTDRATARGAVQILISAAISLAAGLFLHVFLARTLQPQLYGILAVVTSVIIWWEAAAANLIREATERAVAAAGEAWRGVAGTSLQAALATSVLLAALCWGVASLLADALGDQRLTGYIRLMSLDIPLYVLWWQWSSVLNGRRLYGRRALSHIAYWVAKAALMCGLVALGWSVRGAIIGSICASVVGLVVAWGLAGVGLPAARFPVRELLVFGAPLMALAIADRLMISMDLWFVKAVIPDPDAAGVYGIAKYVFQAAIMLSLTVCGAAFPTLTRAIESGNDQSIEELIQQSSRFVILLTAPIMAIMACCGRQIVTVVFGGAYAASAPAITILVGAALLFGLRLVANTTLIAGNRPGLVLAISAPLVPLNIWLNYVLVSSHGLVGAATATGVTFLCAAAAVWFFVWRRFEVLPFPISALRVGIAAAAIYGLGLLLPAEGWLALLEAVGLGGLYLVILGILRELTARDLEPLLFWRGAR